MSNKNIKRHSRIYKGLGLHKFKHMRIYSKVNAIGTLYDLVRIEVNQDISSEYVVTLHPTKGYRCNKKIKE